MIFCFISFPSSTCSAHRSNDRVRAPWNIFIAARFSLFLCAVTSTLLFINRWKARATDLRNIFIAARLIFCLISICRLTYSAHRPNARMTMPKKVFIAARFSFARVFCCSCLSWAQHINARYKDSCITLKITHRMRTFFLCTALHVASMSDFRELAVMRNTLQSRELLFCIARRSRCSALRHDISVSSIFFSSSCDCDCRFSISCSRSCCRASRCAIFFVTLIIFSSISCFSWWLNIMSFFSCRLRSCARSSSSRNRPSSKSALRPSLSLAPITSCSLLIMARASLTSLRSLSFSFSDASFCFSADSRRVEMNLYCVCKMCVSFSCLQTSS